MRTQESLYTLDDFLILDVEDYDLDRDHDHDTDAGSNADFDAPPTFPEWMCSRTDPFRLVTPDMGMLGIDEEDPAPAPAPTQIRRRKSGNRRPQEQGARLRRLGRQDRDRDSAAGNEAASRASSSSSSPPRHTLERKTGVRRSKSYSPRSSSSNSSSDLGSGSSLLDWKAERRASMASLSALESYADDGQSLELGLRQTLTRRNSQGNSSSLSPIDEHPRSGVISIDRSHARWAVYSPSTSKSSTPATSPALSFKSLPDPRRTSTSSSKESTHRSSRKKQGSASVILPSDVLMQIVHGSHPPSSFIPRDYLQRSSHAQSNSSSRSRSQSRRQSHSDMNQGSKSSHSSSRRRPFSTPSFSASYTTLEPVFESPVELNFVRISSHCSQSSHESTEASSNGSCSTPITPPDSELPTPIVAHDLEPPRLSRALSMKSLKSESRLAFSKIGRFVRNKGRAES